jgi:tRNA wybutosine-synthesizing protein 1
MQFTPSLQFCTLGCKFCWRDTSFTYPKWNIKENKKSVADPPDKLLDEAIEQQAHLLSGFKGNDKVDMKKWKEAQSPKHLAISLAGEPTLYPLISDLILETRKRKMTSFLVSNGTNPKTLQEMEMPSQLYVTVAAPNEEIYKKTCFPLQKQAWKNLNITLESFSSFSTRKVIRLTLVKKLNFLNPKQYANLIDKSGPDFVEVKAFMSVGFSRARIPYEDMPLHTEIQEFAKQISDEISYPIVDEKKDSRVVLLSRSGNKSKV